MEFELHFNWVLINKLALGRYPKSYCNLKFLRSKNIKSILSLCDEVEAPLPKNTKDFFLTKSFILPDHKTGIIPKAEEINEVIKILSELINDGPVYVHCYASVERSPLICIAWLIAKHKMSINDALTYLMDIHKLTNPLQEQINVLKKIKVYP